MNYNFNESSLIVGQIKELLHNFNLPLVPVWNDEIEFIDSITFDSKKITPFVGRTYIKDGKIQTYTTNGWVILDDYLYDTEIANFTKNLIINSSIYDDYTHTYLGNYLRFVRDYHKVNVMPLYNCFSGRRPSRIYKKTSKKVQIPEFDSEGKISSYKEIDLNIDLDTDNTGYNYYIVPIKFNQTYTIGLDADTKYDICCILYSNNFVSTTPDKLIKESFRTISGSRLTKPFLYNTNFESASELWSKENDLVLLLKLPSEIDSTITILEGNYTQGCNIIDGTLITKFNEFDKDFEDKNDDDKYQKDYSSKLSLLRVNNGKSYPFADRLVEYILGHMITSQDFINTNIERVQDQVYPNGIKGYYGIWDDRLRNNIYNILNKKDLTRGSNDKFGNTIVIDSVDQPKEPKRFIDIYHDISGFVDKDTEIMLEVNSNE